MKDYQDLTIHSDRPAADIVAALDAHLSNGWTHDLEAEQRVKGFPGGAPIFNYHCTQSANRSEALLSIMSRGGALQVINIIPYQGSRLTHEQYNIILGEFYSQVVQPAEVEGIFTAALFSDEVDLQAELGAEVFGKLELFSNAANKATGSAHPMDRERWFDFLCAISRSDAQLDTTTLGRWLREVHEWPDEEAHVLCLEYEFALGLLKHNAKG